MKAYKLELKTLQLEVPADRNLPPPPVKYADLLTLILKVPAQRDGQQQGITKAEMKLRNRVRRNLSEANGSLLMGHEEYQLVKRLVDGFPFGVAAFEIEQFQDDVEACPEVPVVTAVAE